MICGLNIARDLFEAVYIVLYYDTQLPLLVSS